MSLFISKKMKYFLTVAETLNLTMASEQLFVTRSPLGKAIIEIENEIGFNLFERGRTSLILTKKGESLYNKLHPLHQQLLLIEKSFKNNQNPQLLFDEDYPDTILNMYKSQLVSNEHIFHDNVIFNDSFMDDGTNFIFFLLKKNAHRR